MTTQPDTPDAPDRNAASGGGSKVARRSIFEGLPRLKKPDFADLPKPNFDLLLEDRRASEEAAKNPKGKKLRAAEATGLDGLTMLHREGAKKRTFYDLATSRRAVAALGRLPEFEESFHCLMGGDYHGFDLVIAVRELAGAPIDELHVATLGFNRYNIQHLCEMLDARDIGAVRMVCSEYFAGADAETFAAARSALERRGHILRAARNHAKLLLFAIGSLRYAVESSANLRSCNNLEQFTLTASPALYEFHRAWIERVINHAD